MDKRIRMIVITTLMYILLFCGYKTFNIIDKHVTSNKDDSRTINYTYIISSTSVTNTDSIDISILYNYLILKDALYPEIIVAQAILETGYFTSSNFKLNCNLFGMKVPKIRLRDIIGESINGYAVYKNWMQSVNDYILWQKHCIDDTYSYNQYLDYIDRVYAEDPEYINKLKILINRHSKTFNNDINTIKSNAILCNK